jgi:lysine 2,3-aminomutase
MEEWRTILSKPIKLESIKGITKEDIKNIKLAAKTYPMYINSYYFSLIKSKDDPIYKQCIPNIEELNEDLSEDPLAEETHTPTNGIVHKYPDRALFLISNICTMYCRFCTRKRKVGKKENISNEEIKQGLQYLKDHEEIRDVILSGGDPLTHDDNKIEYILKQLREIKHIEIIRLGTRVPCALPQRITENLCNILKKYHPIFINTHFNHPNEITEESSKACTMLANAGIPLGNQTVLLKGINDNIDTIKSLVHKLLKIRVKPYYLYHADKAKGTKHFMTNVKTGMEIIKGLRGWTSGLAVPQYVIDTEGGKIPILPEYLKEYKDGKIILKNYQDKEFTYIDP